MCVRPSPQDQLKNTNITQLPYRECQTSSPKRFQKSFSATFSQQSTPCHHLVLLPSQSTHTPQSRPESSSPMCPRRRPPRLYGLHNFEQSLRLLPQSHHHRRPDNHDGYRRRRHSRRHGIHVELPSLPTHTASRQQIRPRDPRGRRAKGWPHRRLFGPAYGNAGRRMRKRP